MLGGIGGVCTDPTEQRKGIATKMLGDIFLTTKMGSGISSGATKLSNRVRQVFGAESVYAKNAASFARLTKNNEMVTGWTVQMYNDNYQSAVDGGIQSEEGRHFYAASTSFIQSLIHNHNNNYNLLHDFLPQP